METTITKVIIQRIPNTPVSDELRELVHTLISKKIPLYSDRATVHKFIAHGAAIQEIPLRPNLVLPLEVKIYFTASSHFALINNADFAWFQMHLKRNTLPSPRVTPLLRSRNQAMIAFLTSQKEVQKLQSEVIEEQLTPAS